MKVSFTLKNSKFFEIIHWFVRSSAMLLLLNVDVQKTFISSFKGPYLGFNLFSDKAFHKIRIRAKFHFQMTFELCQAKVLMVFVHLLLSAENE